MPYQAMTPNFQSLELVELAFGMFALALGKIRSISEGFLLDYDDYEQAPETSTTRLIYGQPNKE